MRLTYGRAARICCLVALGFLFAMTERAEAQARPAARPGLPTRPGITTPQLNPNNGHLPPGYYQRPAPMGNAANFGGFNNNAMAQNFGFNGYNYADLNAWNNLSMTGWPYWNTMVDFNPFTMQNFVWSQPIVPPNANPFVMNVAFTNMWNNYFLMNNGMNGFGMMGNAMPVGNWNGFNMPMNNANGFNPGMGWSGFNPAALMNLNPNANANGVNR